MWFINETWEWVALAFVLASGGFRLFLSFLDWSDLGYPIWKPKKKIKVAVGGIARYTASRGYGSKPLPVTTTIEVLVNKPAPPGYATVKVKVPRG